MDRLEKDIWDYHTILHNVRNVQNFPASNQLYHENYGKLENEVNSYSGRS